MSTRIARALCAFFMFVAATLAQVTSSLPTAAPAPNYELAARFMPSKVGKMVFDTSVTPHWFENSDRFWYSYETSDGARWWVVDPVKRTRVPLWDNSKMAIALNTLTNFPYNSQHLPLRNVKLVKNDATIRFDIEISSDGVIPEEKKEGTEENGEENNQDETQRGRNGQRAAGEEAERPRDTRTIYFEYDLATGKVTRLDGFQDRRRPMWAAISPDENTIVFARGHNLYMMDGANYAKALKNPADASVAETQLTTDGEERNSYARHLITEDAEQLKKEDKKDAENKSGMRTPAVSIHWSKDSKKFALVRNDDRKVADLWVVLTLKNPRPVLESYPYAMPGEENVPIPELVVFDVASRKSVKVQARNFYHQMLSIEDAPVSSREREQQREQQGERQGAGQFRTSPRWLADGSDKLYFSSMSRNFRSVDICVADTATGAVKTLIQERANVWLDVKPVRLVNNGAELIWWSERDGWGHYYLYDGATGKLKNQITTGEYMADQVVSVDNAAHAVYFTATGYDRGEDPYYNHLFRTNLDGSGLKMVANGNFSHAFTASDDGKYIVDNYSRVDTAPRSVVYDAQGSTLVDLETTDVKRLAEAGFKFPETFHVKADDGITDLYGVLYKPFDFDPNRKYPLIEFVYPGPQTESVTKTFTPKSPNIALAQMGFIVIEVGGRGGSPQRDKWYDAFGYGNLRDYGLADKKAAAEQLAAIHPYIDLNRVGIWGHSGGGFMTAAALMQYPDFFKAGWSESGNHDNNVYNKTWSEKYHGVREEPQKDGTAKFIYNIDKNSDLAKNLKGHLMLTTGDMDDNVHMANTMRLADALIKANKRFEMLVFPGMRHAYTPIGDYVIMRRGDFFAEWLMGSPTQVADIVELQRDKLATPGRKGQAGQRSSGPEDVLDPANYPPDPNEPPE
ncbi:MAG: DPP IV N-terminal domain-containing protein [Acidobacteria bacterium]|nr:DPP IV N-terminal domain-containing protein [Acidobacteriota bacterium]